jgi:type IV pilus assembly protein PilA
VEKICPNTIRNAKAWHSQAKGFSLAEVLVIVGVAVLLAAALLPGLLNSRIAANEASTIANLDSITSAQEAYKTAYPEVGYSDSLSRLALVCGQRTCQPSAEQACLIDCKLPQATTNPRYGYFYNLSAQAKAGPRQTYVIAAAPDWLRRTGDHDFCAVEDVKVRSRLPTTRTAATSIDRSVCLSFAVLP